MKLSPLNPGLPVHLLLITTILPASGRNEKAVDADSDGIPREWEESRGMSDRDAADARVDFDRDGLTNFEEYLSGGLPWGKYSFHRFALPPPPGGIKPEEVEACEPVAWNRNGTVLVAVFLRGGGWRLYRWMPEHGAAGIMELTPAPSGSIRGLSDMRAGG
jgi:hypothetical protein